MEIYCLKIIVRFGAKSQIVQRGIGVGSLVVIDGVYHRSNHSLAVHNAVHCTQKKNLVLLIYFDLLRTINVAEAENC